MWFRIFVFFLAIYFSFSTPSLALNEYTMENTVLKDGIRFDDSVEKFKLSPWIISWNVTDEQAKTLYASYQSMGAQLSKEVLVVGVE